MSETKKIARTLIGKVTSNAMDKTIVVVISRQVKHPVYGKFIRRSTKVHAHDAKNICQIGDMVSIKQSRPLSKTKHWELVEVVEKATEQ